MSKKIFPRDFGLSSVGFFGLGKSNLAILEELSGSGVRVTLRSDKKIDREKIPPGVNISAILEGDSAFSSLCEELLVLSPSVRRERIEFTSAQECGVKLTSDAELFFECVDSPVYAVSGSDGKSTTATLTHLLLGGKACGAALCGNIGVPMTPLIRDGYGKYAVELSSFMLRYLNPITQRAALTNITPNHLDWHADFEEYKETKLSLLRKTREPIINLDDGIISGFRKSAFAAVSLRYPLNEARRLISAEVYYTLMGGTVMRNGEPYIEVEKIRRREGYNLKNFMLALALTEGVRGKDFAEVARDFGGLKDRCELVAECGGIRFINSSIDTSPDRCAVTLSSLNLPAVVILGGKGKGVPFTPIREPLRRVGRAAVVLGECREDIIAALPTSLPYRTAGSMAEAVSAAIALARCGDTVILSPAATSYDAYGSFEERGDDFKNEVEKYCKEHL